MVISSVLVSVGAAQKCVTSSFVLEMLSARKLLSPLNQLLDAASVVCLVGELGQQNGAWVTTAVSCIEGEQCRRQDTSLLCPGVCCSCAGNRLAHPHPLGSACKKAEQPLDQRWVDRHGQEFVYHEMWLDTVEKGFWSQWRGLLRMCFASQGVHIGDGEGLVWRP